MENLVFKSFIRNYTWNSLGYNWKFFLQKYSKRKQKEEAKNTENIKGHSEQVFGVYQFWRYQNFSTYIDLISFDLDNLKLNVVNQIIPHKAKPNEKFKSRWERALIPLNCEEYKNTYDKYNEILNFETNFNDKINQFVSKERNDIILEIGLQDLEQNKHLINDLLRIILYKSRDMGNPKATEEGIKFSLTDLRINVDLLFL